MLTTQRRREILDLVQKNGQVIVHELSQHWQISEDAIRRDLRELSHQGLLKRVHGGAISASPAEGDYANRENISVEVKDKLAKAAIELIQDKQIIAIDGGTTNLHLIRYLPKNLRLTIVTHSPIIAAELRSHELVEVILLGGKLFKHSMVCLGPETLSAIQHLHLDLFFLGATGVHAEAGITSGKWEETTIKRAFCSRSAEVALLASPEKLNAASPHVIIPSAELNVLVVDEERPAPVSQNFSNLGVRVIQAGTVLN